MRFHVKRYDKWPAVLFGVLILIGIALSESADASTFYHDACADVGIDCPTVQLADLDTQAFSECKTHEGVRMCRIVLDRDFVARSDEARRQAFYHELCHVKEYMARGKTTGHKRYWSKCAAKHRLWTDTAWR